MVGLRKFVIVFNILSEKSGIIESINYNLARIRIDSCNQN